MILSRQPGQDRACLFQDTIQIVVGYQCKLGIADGGSHVAASKEAAAKAVACLNAHGNMLLIVGMSLLRCTGRSAAGGLSLTAGA